VAARSTSSARRGSTPGCARRTGRDRSARRGACAVPRPFRAGRPGVSRHRSARYAFSPRAWCPPLDNHWSDAEHLPESPPPQRRDGDGLAVLHPFHPAEIEVALRDRGPNHTRDVWTPLGPIEAEPAKVAATRTPRRKLDPEPGEEADARCRDFSRLVID